MRELSRGGSLVAATIAALHSRAAPERRRASRPRSTASDPSERDSLSLHSSEDPPPQNMLTERSLMSDREFLTEPFEEEEERGAAVVHPAVRSYMYSPMGGDSDSPDEATVKCTGWAEAARGPLQPASGSSDSASTTSSDSDSEEGEYGRARDDADYRTLTPSRRLDTSTRRDDDFKWMPTDDAAEPKSMESRAEDYCSASLDRRRRAPSDRHDRDRKTRSSLGGKPPQHPSSSVRASPRPRRPREEDSPAELQRRWNSYEHFRWGPEGGWWPPPCWCHAPPPPPPCCMHDRSWPSHPSLPPVPARTYKSESEDRVRRLEADKESLQLQAQVLAEQVAAQADKMADLERALHDARQRLDDADQRLQKEMLQRSSLETQKLELLSKLSEMRLRVAERGVLERSPPPEAAPLVRPQPPRTPPANYGRQIERNSLMYSSLPRSAVSPAAEARLLGKHCGNMVVAGRGQSVPNLAEKDEVVLRGSPSPSLREVRTRLGSAGAGGRIEGGELARGPLRATAAPRMMRDRPAMQWQTTDIRQWDADTTCGWLESTGLDCYVPAARAWLGAARGGLAAAAPGHVDRELQLKHPMHKKKIMLAVTDLLGGHGDPLLTAAGQLDTAWTLRWLEDVGVCGARAPAADAALDGRGLHRLAHHDLHHHLRVATQLHALSVRRGIQVLRDHDFSPDVMIRRAAEGGAGGAGAGEDVTRWSSHRVMQWLNEIDLAEYAPNLRGAGVHGGLLVLEPRFTAELLAALLNIPASKTLLRRHLTQRFNDLLGRDVIQQKRTAEQTLGYQPLTATTKYKVPKRSQFTLKRRKSREEEEEAELVCPRGGDSGDAAPTMRVKPASGVASAVSPPRDAERAH